MNKRTFFYISLCVTAPVFFSCSSNCKESGTCECVTRFDCVEGQICRAGVCEDESTDAWIVPERKFGETCISHGECIDGVCLPLGPENGGVCTRECTTHEACGSGYTCRAWTGNGVEVGSGMVCVAETPSRLCSTCAVDGHCNASGDLCIETKAGYVCSQDCSIDPCPVGYTCEPYERGDAEYAQCIPIGNSCECGEGKSGMGRSCSNDNDFGSCSGWTYCQEKDGRYAWSSCDAPEPAQEICNGIDDDCDGLVDGDDPSLKLESDSEEDLAMYPVCYLGGCIGRWQCGVDEKGEYGWHCDAGDPEREICNGVDDNCNGEIDEAFVDSRGLYVDVNNCGVCGASCGAIVAHLRKDDEGNVVDDAVTCEVRGDTPVCVPKLCEDGYYPYPHEAPVSCIKLESPACQVCAEDEDCGVYSDVCRGLGGDFGKHCIQSCSENSPYPGCTGDVGVQSCCPDGYTCELREGAKRCIPRGETCSCTETKLGSVRNCVVMSATGICQGRQRCESEGEATFAWSSCSAQELTQELCDGQDNDCDGEIDEGFRDADGFYNHPAHCGACNSDCESRWKAPELHADGACLKGTDNYECRFTGCKKETMVLGKRCQMDSECGDGMKCDRQVYYCVADGGETPAVPCGSDDACRSIDRAQRCVDGVCRTDVQFYDVNGIDADGCECGAAVDGGGDDPDIFGVYPSEHSNYVDRNCDGIDGTVETSLFVSAVSDRSLGTREHPYKTIGEAVDAFDLSKHSGILVAAGTYFEQVVVRSGVRLYGGYSHDFSHRNIVLNPTQIMAPPPSAGDLPGTIYIRDAARRTIVSGFAISGYDADDAEVPSGQAGHNTYAVYIEKARSGILVANNMILAGRAGDGGPGRSGESGYAGNDGSNGRNSRECNDHYCIGESTPGGSAGINAYCSAANGRTGAAAHGGTIPQSFDGYGDPRDGAGGANNSYNYRYPEHEAYCKYDCTSGGYANGSDGRNGENGSHGVGGNGCFNVNGIIRGHEWAGRTAGSGGAGGAASGGGGGGAGGSAVNNNSDTCTYGRPVGDVGGSGGGGAAGGCGGTGGTGGGSGGGSFGIWMAETESSPAIYGNIIRLGRGGNGGAGGDGGAGGNGGKGGRGGGNDAPAWCAGAGGSGGGGGNGGAGGGGGGGCGGLSAGIAGIGMTGNFENSNIFEQLEEKQMHALGGQGGDSPAGETCRGKDGRNGIFHYVVSF